MNWGIVMEENGNAFGAEVAPNVGRLCDEGWIKKYLEYTKNQASPELFHVWTAVAVLAGALRRNVYIDRGGYYTLYPNLYIILVAPQGRCMKSTAASIGARLLKRIEGVRIMHEKITPEGLISYLSGEMRGVNPTFSKVYRGKHVQISRQCNCFIFAPELSVFLGGVAYTIGLIELLTSLYEGKDTWEYRTKTRGCVELENVNVNLFGASTPDWLAKGFSEDAFGGGFMGRTIYVYQDEGKKIAWPEKPTGMEDTEIMLLHDLMRISQLSGEYAVPPETKNFYEKWHDKYAGDFSSRMAGYYERKPDHALKLAMILAASYSDEMTVTKGHVEESLNMLTSLEMLMPKAFAYIGATSEAITSQKIIETISNTPHQFMAYRKLLSSVRHMIRNRKEFDEIIDTLSASGQIRVYVKNNARYLTLDKDIKSYLELVEAAAEIEAQTELNAAKKKGLAAAAAAAGAAVGAADGTPQFIPEEKKDEQPPQSAECVE